MRAVIYLICIVLMISIAPAAAQKTIIVGGEIDYPPYCFLDENGRPTGFQVDLTRSIARVMGMEIEIKLSSWGEARKGLENGTIDIICGMFYSDERAEVYDFSPPYAIVSSVIFARKDAPSVQTIDDLRDKEIIVMRGEVMHDLVVKQKITQKLILAETPDDVLRRLEAGDGDYALGAQMPGLYWIDKLGLSNITTMGKPIEPFKDCFSVRKGNTLLLSRFTEGLMILQQTGEYQKLYHKWFGVLQTRGVSLTKVFKYAAVVFLPLLALLMAAFMWSLILKKQVGARTISLHNELIERKQTEAALRESEERFRLQFENAPLPSQSLDADGNIIAVNSAWLKALGYSREEVLGQWFGNFLPVDYQEIFRERFPQFKKMGEIFGAEFEMVHKDGSLRIVSFDGRIGFNPDGSFRQTYCVFKDLTSIRQAQESLQESEESLVRVLEGSQMGYWDWNIETGDVKRNERWAGMLGYTLREIEFNVKQWTDLHHPDDRAAAWKSIQDHLEGRTDMHQIEYRMRAKDGQYKWILDCAKVVRRDAQGRPLRMSGTHTDISDRKKTEEKLKEANEMFSLFMRHSPIYTFIKEVSPAQSIVLQASDNFREMLGMTGREIIGKNMTELFPPDFAAKITADDWAVVSNGEVLKLDEELNGRSYTTIKFPLAQGGKNLLAGYTIDITEHKRAEEEREKMQAQLNQALKMESVGRLAGGVAHDFNNMLGIILGHTEMAMDQVDPVQPLYDDLSEIRKAAERSADLTRQLLAFARKQTVAPMVLDLNETVESMLKMLRRLIGEDIDLAWLPGPGMWPVKVDPTQIDQILANLCLNARDAIAGLGKVTIETENVVFDEAYCAENADVVPGEYVLIAVSDDGLGMDKSILDKLFEPFFTTKEMGKGTGLGLATVYGIVKQNNGFVKVYSEPGHGTTFRIYLPRHRGKSGQLQKEFAAEPAATGHETILLVEDEPAILRMTTKMLERLGYTVLAANTPGAAIRLAEAHPAVIHLLMTDVVMPEMNGRDLAKNLLSLYPHLKRLFMSGYTADVIAHHGVLDEGVHFIQKPFTMKALADMLRSVLDNQ